VDQADQWDHNPTWWTRTRFYIWLMQAAAKPHQMRYKVNARMRKAMKKAILKEKQVEE